MTNLVSPGLQTFPDVSDQTVRRLVRDMDRDGFGLVPNYIQSRELQELQSFVTNAVHNNGHEYVLFTGRDAVSGTFLDALYQSPAFFSLCKRIYEYGSRGIAPGAAYYLILRCLAGKMGQRHSLIFHYDSYVVTALLPIEMPAKGGSGDLIMLPNTRKIRRLYVTNLLDKIVIDNMLSQASLRYLIRHHLIRFKRVTLIPGNVYFFWGYRSVHTNMACDPDEIRATALFHYGDPHAGSRLRRVLGKVVV